MAKRPAGGDVGAMLARYRSERTNVEIAMLSGMVTDLAMLIHRLDPAGYQKVVETRRALVLALETRKRRSRFPGHLDGERAALELFEGAAARQ